jgi:ElaB/YqjD/DUF883 family membrane-anchored ribosome-binding protein
MDKEPDVAELAKQEPEVIRSQIEETRSSLTEKLETLEQEVKETVSEAKTAVTETVETVKETVENTVEAVKDTVQGTVETVKHTFDLRCQVDRHPWGMMAGSMLTGFLVGTFLPTPWTDRSRRTAWGRDGESFLRSPSLPEAETFRETRLPAESVPRPEPAPEPSGPGLLSSLTDTFGSELNQLKGMAIGAALGLLRDTLTQSLTPTLAPRVREVIDSVTTKLGGEPLQGPLLKTQEEDTATHGASCASVRPPVAERSPAPAPF